MWFWLVAVIVAVLGAGCASPPQSPPQSPSAGEPSGEGRDASPGELPERTLDTTDFLGQSVAQVYARMGTRTGRLPEGLSVLAGHPLGELITGRPVSEAARSASDDQQVVVAACFSSDAPIRPNPGNPRPHLALGTVPLSESTPQIVATALNRGYDRLIAEECPGTSTTFTVRPRPPELFPTGLPVIAADGTNYEACRDGACEIVVTAPVADIPTPNGPVSVTVLGPEQVTITVPPRRTGNARGGATFRMPCDGALRFSADQTINGGGTEDCGRGGPAPEQGYTAVVAANIIGSTAILRIVTA